MTFRHPCRAERGRNSAATVPQHLLLVSTTKDLFVVLSSTTFLKKRTKVLQRIAAERVQTYLLGSRGLDEFQCGDLAESTEALPR